MAGCGDDGSVTFTATPTPGTPSGTTTIRAFVYSANGQPVEGISVAMTQMATTELTSSIDPQVTDENGMVIFTGSFQGVYLIQAKDSSGNLLGSQEFSVLINDFINIFLGHVTGKLTVKIDPEAVKPNVSKLELSGIPVEFVTSSALSQIEGAIAGDAIFYLPAGNYSLTGYATGYSPATLSNIAVAEGGEQEVTLTFDDEIPVGLSIIEPRICVNTGSMPATIKGENFVNPPDVTLIPVNGGTSITASNVVVIDSETVGCSFDLTGAATGEYTVEVDHSPITTANTTDSYTGFWVVDTIQTGIDKANELYVLEGGEQVKAFVPAGEYLYGDAPLPDLPLQMRTGVHIMGADTATVIDGDWNGSIFSMFEVQDLTIEGFTLTEGSGMLGGAIFALGVGNMTITGNTIAVNDSIAGGGIFYFNLLKHSPSLISNNAILYNYGGLGGAIATGGADCSITGNRIGETGYENYAGVGGGIATLSYLGSTYNIIGNVIKGNMAEIAGGGILSSTEPTAIINIRDNEITENTVPPPSSPKLSASGDIIYDGEPGGSGIYFFGFLSDKSYINYNNIYGNISSDPSTFPGQQVHYFYVDSIDGLIDQINPILNSLFGITLPNLGTLPGPADPALNGQYNWWGRIVDPSNPLTDDDVYPSSPKGIDNSVVNTENPADAPYTEPEVPSVPAGFMAP